ncbi:hypothetical protein B0H10DRAFT_1955771 [Mycena sp. CBHHK59/15]|nr:hypothetical protein B0H10DRAFT_1955771 [Mycena sp. CBHHK59/15]
MDTNEARWNNSSSSGASLSEPGNCSDQDMGAFFLNAQNLVVSRGVSASNIKYITNCPPTPSDDPAGRLGPAKGNLNGQQTSYRGLLMGRNAEEDWQLDLDLYSGIRGSHPNILQIYGVVKSCKLYAAIFHDDLVPYDEMFRLYCDSPILDVCFKACARADIFFRRQNTWLPQDALCYIYLISGKNLIVDPNDSTWTKSGANHHLFAYFGKIPYTSEPLFNGVASVSNAPTCTNAVVVCRLFSANVPACSARDPILIGNGWSRFNSHDMNTSGFHCMAYLSKKRTLLRVILNTDSYLKQVIAWLSQANYIFTWEHITFGYEDYFSSTSYNIPNSYLFLCPLEDLQGTDRMQFGYPEISAYWSLDPSGAERLNTNDADKLGFPPLMLGINVRGISSIHQFYQAKGFDPDSQEITQHLGYPLYQLSAEPEVEFAHIEDDLLSDDPHGMGILQDALIEWRDLEKSVKPRPPLNSPTGTLSSVHYSTVLAAGTIRFILVLPHYWFWMSNTPPVIWMLNWEIMFYSLGLLVSSSYPSSLSQFTGERAGLRSNTQNLESCLDVEALVDFLQKDPESAGVYNTIDRDLGRPRKIGAEEIRDGGQCIASLNSKE